MLRDLLRKLLHSAVSKKHHGSHYRPHYSSDSYSKRPHYPNHHNPNHYGSGYYKKKRKSSFFSS